MNYSFWCLLINSTTSRIVQRLGYSAFTSSDLKHRKDPGSIPGTGKAFPFCVRDVFVDAVVVGPGMPEFCRGGMWCACAEDAIIVSAIFGCSAVLRY
jgi:hypothetical protein